MKLSSYLESKFIFTEVAGQDIQTVISNILNLVAQKDPKVKKNKAKILDSLTAKEEKVSSAIGSGLSLPYARSSSYDDVLVAIGIPKNKIEMKTASNEIDLIKAAFIVIVPESENKLLLSLVAAISQFAETSTNIKEIYKLNSSTKILNYIEEHQQEIATNIMAASVMKYVKTASLDDSIKELVQKFVYEQVDAIPVVQDGIFIGEASSFDIIALGLPSLAAVMKNVRFITDSSPFEDYFKAENLAKVRDILKKKVVTVARDASIMEVGFLMYKKRVNRVYVVEKGKYFGTIFISDIIKKVLHL